MPISPRTQSSRRAGLLGRADRERIQTQLRLFETARPFLPSDPIPHYLAHMRVSSQGKTTDVLLTAGPRPRFDPTANPDLLLVDWQESPFAEVFFSCREQGRYELATPKGVTTGTVLELNLVGFDASELALVIAPDRVLSRRRDGVWQRSKPQTRLLKPRPRAARARAPSLIDVQLDPAQTRLVNLPAGRSLLVLGEAGHGKTTVAIHRLAHLKQSAARRFRAVVILPTEGLRGLVETLLKRLGIEVEVSLYDTWAARQARRAFSDIPRRESQDATAGVIRMKRDPALRVALAAVSKNSPARIDDDLDTKAPQTKAWAHYADLQQLFGDRALMKQVAAAASQPMSTALVAEVLEHAHVQFSQTAEEQYAHVEEARLLTLDGRPIDEGTPMQDAGTIDPEDYAVLFELDRLRAERHRGEPTRPRAYDCIVLDEAQEFAPLELALIGRSLTQGGTLIVAGDADQQLDPAACFTTWPQTMTDLGCCDYENVVLEVGYRCPPEVVSIARQLITPNASDPRRIPAARVKARSEVLFTSFTTECHLASCLIGELRRVKRFDRRGSVAVICRSALTARRLCRVLRYAVDARLVLDGRFSLDSGIHVTSVDQVKGLEFDYVIVPDASEAAYPDTPQSRRALYVAVTRTRHQLLLGAVGVPTPLINSELSSCTQEPID